MTSSAVLVLPSEVTPPFIHPLWIPNNPPPPAIIPAFETEEQIRSHRLAGRLALAVLAINIVGVFLAGFGWEIPRPVVMMSIAFNAPFTVSWLRKKEREERRKMQAREALDEELGAVVDEEEKRAGL